MKFMFFSIKYRYSDISLKNNSFIAMFKTVLFTAITLVIVLVSVTSASRYQIRSSMNIRGLIPRKWPRRFRLLVRTVPAFNASHRGQLRWILLEKWVYATVCMPEGPRARAWKIGTNTSRISCQYFTFCVVKLYVACMYMRILHIAKIPPRSAAFCIRFQFFTCMAWFYNWHGSNRLQVNYSWNHRN